MDTSTTISELFSYADVEVHHTFFEWFYKNKTILDEYCVKMSEFINEPNEMHL